MFIKVKVFPDSKDEEIIRKSEDEFEVKVRAKAENRKANERVRELLANYLSISKEKLVIVKGHKQKNKLFKIY